MAYKTLDEHLFGPGPKRILALDGGGIRGALTLGYLKKVEDILRERAGGDPEFRLCDYFDLIAGTSTGSIIAAGLALGFSVQKLQEIYQALADEVFKTSFFRRGVFSAKFPKEPLLKALTEYYGEATLGSSDLKTGLLVVTKRLDTGSPWLMHNNPKGKYFNVEPGSTSIPNKDYLLKNVVRASTAAPHYFEPEKIQIASDMFGAFVDGGVSPYNNPALQALMVATTKGYGFDWGFGEDQLLLVSAGTGHENLRLDPEAVLEMPAVQLAAQSILSIMADANWLLQAILQWMSRTPTAWEIDSEVGTLRDDVLGGGNPLISYLRYDVVFEPEWMKETLNVDMTEAELKSLAAMDDPKNVSLLNEVGGKAAAAQIVADHFSPAFDVKK